MQWQISDNNMDLKADFLLDEDFDAYDDLEPQDLSAISHAPQMMEMEF